jgi:hypothetical protein
MRKFEASVPETAFVAVTRGMVGAGAGLLVSEFIPRDARRAVGWTLLAIGALTTVPIAVTLIRRAREPRMLAD